MKTLTGQAKNWIYPKIGATKLRDFTATDADNFFKELGQVLSAQGRRGHDIRLRQGSKSE